MPQVFVEHRMLGVRLEQVWSIASQLVDYPTFMDQVVKVEACEVVGVEHATSWSVLLNGSDLCWIEVDRYYEADGRIEFEQIEGDLAEWRGSFQARAEGSDVIARYEVSFDLGVPSLAELLHPLGAQAIKDNCGQMLREIEIRCNALNHANA
jgi:hypothetical protein